MLFHRAGLLPAFLLLLGGSLSACASDPAQGRTTQGLTTATLAAPGTPAAPGPVAPASSSAPTSPQPTSPSSDSGSATTSDQGRAAADAPATSAGRKVALPSTSTAAKAFEVYVDARGADQNTGLTSSQAVRTLRRVHEILVQRDPQLDIRVRVAGGRYYCQEPMVAWTYRNGRNITIEPLKTVPGPAATTADSPDRPVFVGKYENGQNCRSTVWFTVTHNGGAMNLTLRGLAVTGYRGGVTLFNSQSVPPAGDQRVTIDNVVFRNLGDQHHRAFSADGALLAGKGAILLTYSSGNRVENSLFDSVRNGASTAAAIHGLYFTNGSSRNHVANNTFRNITGGIVKITDYSNHNRFDNNHFQSSLAALVDRWCGAKEDARSACPGGVTQCPSWGNTLRGNTYSEVGVTPVIFTTIPAGQSCRYPAASSRIRGDVEGRVVSAPLS